MSRNLTVAMASKGPPTAPQSQAGGSGGREGLRAWTEVRECPGFSVVPSASSSVPHGQSQTESKIPLAMWFWVGLGG